MEQSLLERARVRPDDVVRDIEPVPVPTKNKEEEKPSWLKALGAALRSETSLGVGYNLYREFIAAGDTGPLPHEPLDQYLLRIESFDVDKAAKELGLEERIGRIPHEFRERLYEARNPDHLEAILASIERRVADSETLQASGLAKSIGAQIAVGLLDPVDWLVTVATGGIGKGVATGSRLARAARAGTSAAAANMAVEAVIATDDATRDGTDIAAAGLLGLAIGGGLGVLGKSDDARIRAAADKVYRAEVSRVDAPAKAELPSEVAPKAVEPERIEVDNFPRPQAASASAAATPLDDPEWWGTKLALPTTFARSLLSDKVHPKVRSLAGKLMDALPRADNEVREITAEREAASLYNRYVGRFYLATEPEFRAWAKANGYGFLRRHLGSEAQQRFNIEVGRAIRGVQQVSAEAKSAAKKVSALFDELRERAKAARVEGFDDIKANPNYLPRAINYQRFHELWKRIGKNGMIELVAGAIRAKGTPPDLAERIAKAYVEGAKRRMLDTDLGFLQGISEDSIERLRHYLPSDDPSLVDDVIAYLKQFRKEGNPDGGRIAQAKQRIDLDENYSVYINGEFVRFADILHEDAGMLFDRYAKTVTGWIGLSNRAGLRSEADYRRFKQDIAADDDSFVDFKDLDAVVDLILGRSLDTDPTGHINRASSLLRKINFARTMGQAGLASIAEVGNAVGYAGMKNMMMHVPGLRTLWRGMKAGQLDKELEEELRWITGVGTRSLAGRGKAGIDDLGLQVEHALYDKVDRVLDPIARGAHYAGLLGPVNNALQVLSAKSFAQKMANWARGAKIDKASRLRMRDAGLHDRQLDRIMDQFRKHSVFDEAGALVRINWQKWDQDLLDEFSFALDRLTYRAVQENDIGSSAPWMHKWWGKTLMQFRGFIFNAYTKQTIHALRYRDIQTFTAFVTTFFVGALVYMTRTWVNYANDRERRNDLLSFGNIVAGAINAMGQFSLLPGTVDTMATWLFAADPIFGFERTTGLAGDFIMGNPTVDLLESTAGTVALPVRLARDDYQFSRDDFRRIARLLPYNNLLGVRNVISVMNKGLPAKSLEDDYWE